VKGSSFIKTDMSGARLENTDFTGVDMEACLLTGATVVNKNLSWLQKGWWKLQGAAFE